MNQKKYRVLIVDDDDISNILLDKLLKGAGHESRSLKSATELMTSLDHELPDLILLDIVMPNMSGLEALSLIRKRFSQAKLPVIMLSSLSHQDSILNAFELGANDYIIKPASPPVALARVNTHLNLKSYYEDSLRKKELETLNAMIVTYNHEVNNPLLIVTANLKDDIKEMDNKMLKNAREATNRILEIVRKIHDATDGNIEYEEYGLGDKMIKLRK